jgi:hypothetical protein
MENDSIRSSGSNTLVDIWIEGRMRGICISREAIEHFLNMPADQAEAMTEDDRCEFVRKNLQLVMSAARSRLREGDSEADAIVIGKGHIRRSETARTGERRKVDRRKAERRTGSRVQGDRPVTDRRRSQRRKGERRSCKSDPES